MTTVSDESVEPQSKTFLKKKLFASPQSGVPAIVLENIDSQSVVAETPEKGGDLGHPELYSDTTQPVTANADIDTLSPDQQQADVLRQCKKSALSQTDQQVSVSEYLPEYYY